MKQASLKMLISNVLKWLAWEMILCKDLVKQICILKYGVSSTVSFVFREAIKGYFEIKLTNLSRKSNMVYTLQ